MAEAYLNGKAGKWRTVGGRRIFIAEGETLKQAMRKSGKFKNLKDDDKLYNERMFKDEIKEMLQENGLSTNNIDEKWQELKEKGTVMVNGYQYNLDDYIEDNKPQELKPLATYLKDNGIDRDSLSKEEYDSYLKEYRRNGEIKSLENNKTYTMDGKKITETDLKAEYKKEYAKGNITESYDDWKQEVTGNRNSNVKEIQLKGGDKTKYKVLDEATDSMGEKIYKVMEDGQEKWVQGDLFEVKNSIKAESLKKDYQKYNSQYEKYAELARDAGFGTPEYEKYSKKRSEYYEKAKQAKIEALTEFNKTIPYDEMFDVAKVISGSKNVQFNEPELVVRDGSVYSKYSSNDIRQDTGVFGSVLKGIRMENFNSNLYINDEGELSYWGTMALRYQHNGGGTNGMELMQYRYNSKTGWDITDSAGYKYKNGKKITTVSSLTDYYMEYYGYSKDAARKMAQASLEDVKRRESDIDY